MMDFDISFAVSYRWILEKIKKFVSEGKDIADAKDAMLGLLMKRRVNEAEHEYISTGHQYKQS